ncbi:hypothetical protein [Conexibacter arvalis]|nr:hypothetical protein [Conexibacter arvalis]
MELEARRETECAVGRELAAGSLPEAERFAPSVGGDGDRAEQKTELLVP